TFGAQATYATGTGPFFLVAGDSNGDGKLDLVTKNSVGSTVSVLLGNGNGTFAPQATFLTGASSDYLAVGDFNADGALDLAVANINGTTVGILLGQAGNLNGLQGSLNIDAGPGSNTLHVSEAGSSAPDTVTVTSSQIVDSAVPFTVNYQATGGSFGGGVNVTTSATAAATVNVQS